MALYQPTNVIPSSYTKGTVDVNDTMEISWQLNGNSAMTAFQIDFYLNDANSTYVTSTGKKGTTPEEQKQLGLPFYGTDRFGRPQFFTWNTDKTWVNWSLNKLTNGNEYKYKITQWYDGKNDVLIKYLNTDIVSGNIYYYKVLSGQYENAVIYFTAPFNLTTSSGQAYYSLTNNTGWIIDNDGNTVIISMVMNKNGIIPPNAIVLDGGISEGIVNEIFLTQTSSNVFISQDKPSLKIYRSSTGEYNDKIDIPNNSSISTSIGFFHAEYEQKQGNSIRWIRWQVATANNGAIDEILSDTGAIYTPTLNFEFNGFFNGQQYAIRAIGESEGGQECNSNPNGDGWIYFYINIENQGEYSGEFTVQCLNKENATLLEWEGVEVIPHTTSPQGYEPTISNGSVTLLPKNGDTEYSVTWDKKIVYNKDTHKNENMPLNFSRPWSLVWKAKLNTKAFSKVITKNGASFDSNVSAAAFSPDGKILVLGGSFTGYASAFAVNGETVTYIGEITKNGTLLRGKVLAAAFSPDGKILVLGGSYEFGNSPTGYASAFAVNGETITYIGEITLHVSTVVQYVMTAAFSPDGKMLVLGGLLGYASAFAVNGETITYIGDITINNTHPNIAIAAFSPDGKILVLGGNFAGYASAFAVNGETITYIGDITKNGTLLRGEVRAAAFSPDGKILVLGGNFAGYASAFAVNGETITYASDITIDELPPDPNVLSLAFSPDGKTLSLGGSLVNSMVYLYSVNNNLSGIVIKNKGRISGGSGLVSVLRYSPNTQLPGGELLIIGSLEPQGYYRIKSPQGKLVNVAPLNLTLTKSNDIYNILLNEENIVTFDTPDDLDAITIMIRPDAVLARGYRYGERVFSAYLIIINRPDWQVPIESLTIFGGDNGTIVESFSVYQGSGIDIINLYNNRNFEPVWNSNEYQLYMTANFNVNLEGGTGTATGSGFRVYRQEVGKSVLTPIATMSSTITSIKDYGIRSRKAYKYSLYAYDNNGAFMDSVENDKVIATCFNNYSLLVCDYDETNDEYHVRKQYLFALNLSVGSVGNNNSPTLNSNFTRYPTRMPSTQNYASGTLQGLIGAIYTIPALIEQIGNYKYTAKPSTLDYFDNVDLEKELYDLSTAPYQLFLRDMKGRLRMVATNSAITMTTNIKQKQQSITISFPWVEIGDASDVTIIQTPDDYGWNNDNQVLDVSLDVDVETGELSATYPFPYNGAKFYLTGVNKETLTAKTPLGVTPTQFDLSETATQPDDGELNATVKVNSEDN